jgi:hypothetical protein
MASGRFATTRWTLVTVAVGVAMMAAVEHWRREVVPGRFASAPPTLTSVPYTYVASAAVIGALGLLMPWLDWRARKDGADGR